MVIVWPEYYVIRASSLDKLAIKLNETKADTKFIRLMTGDETPVCLPAYYEALVFGPKIVKDLKSEETLILGE